jgi:hypothetical protein
MTRQGKQGHTSDGNTPSSPAGTEKPDHPIGARRARDFTLMAHAHFDAPEAGYTDAACIPYTATALAIGEESIYGLRDSPDHRIQAAAAIVTATIDRTRDAGPPAVFSVFSVFSVAEFPGDYRRRDRRASGVSTTVMRRLPPGMTYARGSPGATQ